MDDDELREHIRQAQALLGARASRGIKRLPRKENEAKRTMERDKDLFRHIRNCRNLVTTQQAADLCFGGERSTAETRLYKLRNAGKLTVNNRYGGEVGPVWEMAKKEVYEQYAPEGEERPKPLGSNYIGHLVATNDVYVKLVRLLAKVPGLDPSDWAWTPEPICHRRFNISTDGRNSNKINPDATITIFDELTVFLERQTAKAQARPEAIHEKVGGYHRYENSPDRTFDRHKLLVAWACDAERDKRAALTAAHDDPADTTSGGRLKPYETERMPLIVGSPSEIAHYLVKEISARIRRGA